jgi:hypothetical protein
VLDRLLDVVHQANGGDLSDDVAVLCLSRATADPPTPERLPDA